MSAATRSASSSNPAADQPRPPSSAARASRWSPIPTNQDEALQYIKWFAGADVQKKWWALGGYSCAKSVLNDPGFPDSAPFAEEFLKSMGMVKDFWAEPSYAQLLLAEQKRVHDYVVADKGTAQEALDGLVKDWKASSRKRARSSRIAAWSAARQRSRPFSPDNTR